MNKAFLRLFPIVLLVIVLAGCHRQPANLVVRQGNRYANGFALIDSAQYRIAVVYSPWAKGQEMARYYLSRDTAARLAGKRVIRIPLERVTVTSCTHVGFLNALGQIDRLAGVCNPELVYTDLTESLGQREGTLNLGDAMAPDIERVVFAHPDMMMVSTYAQGDATSAQLEKMGIPVLYINEWMEQHPLARAEWIRLIGVFMDKEAQADSLFDMVVSRYEALREQAASFPEPRPVIMSGQDFRGTWYVPAGNTYMGTLFRDAAAHYPYEDRTFDGSIPLTLEQAMVDFADQADVWVGVNAKTLSELAEINRQHTHFKAFKNGRVYRFKHRTTPTGGNDFWERGVTRPDELLADLMGLLYPNRFEWTFVYTEQLPEK